MNEELKPCPICKGPAEVRAGWSFWVECLACETSTDGWTDMESAIAEWNNETDRAAAVRAATPQECPNG